MQLLDFIGRVFALFFERSDFFVENILEHLWLSAVAIFFSTVIGVGVGIMATRFKQLEKGVLSIVNVIYTIPVIAMLGMLIPLVGIGTFNAVITLTLYALLPMVRGTIIGIKQVDSTVYESALAMGTTPRQLLVRIELPLAMPIIFSGFRSMVVMTIALAGIASMIGAGGLGRGVWRGITTNFNEMIFLSSFLIALMAGIADLILGRFEKRLMVK